MRLVLIALCILGICKISPAQWTTSGSDIYNSNAGNVGIGTSSPTYKLVVSNAGNLGLEIDPANASGTQVGMIAYNRSTSAYKPLVINAEKIILNTSTSGNVGIGTSSPSSLLHVLGSTSSNWLTAFNNSETYGHKLYFGYGNGSDTNYGLIITGGRNSSTQLDFAVENKFYVMGNGNVGIGISSPSSKLSVNGKIQAKEIKVETGWSDFVFEPSYKLRSLKETEQFIKENQHLPEIPSAKEVEKNGINLGEMNAKLLQKIEELTLHMIRMEKENEKQDKIIADQQLKINSLKTR